MKDMMSSQQTAHLVHALLTMESEEDCENLLADLCTVREIQDLAQRLEVARLLSSQMTYNDIAQATGASTATISRVNRCLLYGAGGYRRALDKLEEKEKQND